jgi:hypothetical protein
MPVRVPTIVAVQIDLHLARNRLVCADARTLFDLLYRESHWKYFALPVRIAQRSGRKENHPAHEPVPGIGHEIANGPGPIVIIELARLAHISIRSAKGISSQTLDTSQHCLVLLVA